MIIALFQMPKQRATRPFGFVIRYNPTAHDPQKGYSVHRCYFDGPSTDNGTYDLTWKDAHEEFARRVTENFKSYPSSVYDQRHLPHNKVGDLTQDEAAITKAKDIKL